MWIPVEKSWRLNERHYGALQGLNKAETAAEARRRTGEDLAAQLRHPAAAADRRRRTPSVARSALRVARSGGPAADRVAEGHGRAVPAVLARDHRPDHRVRPARAHRGARQQPACAGQVPRQRVREGDSRAQHPDRHPARLRARRRGSGQSATTISAIRRRPPPPRRASRRRPARNKKGRSAFANRPDFPL